MTENVDDSFMMQMENAALVVEVVTGKRMKEWEELGCFNEKACSKISELGIIYFSTLTNFQVTARF